MIATTNALLSFDGAQLKLDSVGMRSANCPEQGKRVLVVFNTFIILLLELKALTMKMAMVSTASVTIFEQPQHRRTGAIAESSKITLQDLRVSLIGTTEDGRPESSSAVVVMH